MRYMTAPMLLILMLCFGYCADICSAKSTATKDNQASRLKANKKLPKQDPIFGSISASDGIALAYASYVPKDARAALIFYHGSGAHSCAGYTYMAEQLSNKYHIATYLFDVRGHGRSGGPRGDTSDIQQVWRDVRTAFAYVRTSVGTTPIFLGAHSGGSGMLLNYASWQDRIDPAGYFFVTPMLGKQIDIIRDRERTSSKPFARVNHFALWLHYITGGYLAGHWHAVTFNYPEHLIREKQFVSAYTVNMVHALNPSNPLRTLLQMQVPTYLYIADLDELFDPRKLDDVLAPIAKNNDLIRVEHIDRAHHLTVLGEIHDPLGTALCSLIA